MKKKIITLLFFSLLACFCSTAIAQSKTPPLEHYNKGNYREAIKAAADIQKETSRPTIATEWIRAMSYYRLGDYENALSYFRSYFSLDPPDGDDYQQAMMYRVRAQEEMDRIKREREEAARRKAALEREAVAEWEKIKNTTDLSILSSFLSKYKGTSPEPAAQRRYDNEKALLDDEKVWQQAKAQNYIESYENYLNGNTLKKYRQEALDILERSYFSLFNRYKAESNISSMIDMYNRYVKLFPHGSQVQSMKQGLSEQYFETGKKQAVSDNRSILSDAISNFKKAQEYGYQPQSEITDLMQKTQKKLNRLQTVQGNYGWFALTGGTQGSFGISFGGLKYRKLGFYMSASINTLIFKSYEEYNEGKISEILQDLRTAQPQAGFTSSGLYSNIYGNLPAENNGTANITLGLTKGIIYPLWAHLGVGVSYRQPIYEVRVMGRDEKSESLGRYTLATDKARWVPQIDAGLMLRLGKLYISGGACVDYNFKHAYGKAGLGITF